MATHSESLRLTAADRERSVREKTRGSLERFERSARTLAGVIPAISQSRLTAETVSLRRVPVNPASSMRPSTSASVPTVLFLFMVHLSMVSRAEGDIRCQKVTFGYPII